MEIYKPGTMLGQYEVASLPMKGGMGVVYFCSDHGNNGKPVALKTFRPEFLPDREARDRFLREGTAWVNLGSHPHIVRCYNVAYADPAVFLVLELIAKEQNMPDASLRSWLIPGQPLPLEQALLFALQIARGMQHATEKIPGFVHRDLKPENILVGADKLPNTDINRLRITDFGLVKTIADGNLSTTTEIVEVKEPDRIQFTRGVGTPQYMAPEQWTGESIGAYTDIYALGCIMFEMITGQHAASGRTLGDLQVAHSSGKLNPVPGGLPSEVSNLLAYCLATKKERRYQAWEPVTRAFEKVYSSVSGKMAPDETNLKQLNQDERLQMGGAYREIGISYFYINKLQTAMEYLEKAITIARETGDQRTEGIALSDLGLVHKDLGNLERAIDYYEQAIVIALKIGDRLVYGNALGNLASAHQRRSDFNRAIELYKQQLGIAREIGDRRGEGSAVHNLGQVYADLGDIKGAISYYEQSLKIDRETENRRGEDKVLGSLGIAYLHLGDIQQAINHFEQSLAISHEIGDLGAQGRNLGRLGNAYLTVGKAQNAVAHYEQQLLIAHEIDDLSMEADAIGNIGNAYLVLRDAQRAIDYYEKQLLIIRRIEDNGREVSALTNLGSAYLKLDNPQSAIECYEQVLEITRKSGNRSGQCAVLGNLGSVFSNLGDVQLAIKYYDESLGIAREISDINCVATVAFNMALLYSKQDDFVPALQLAKEAIQAFTQIGHVENTQRAQNLVTQLEASMESSEISPTQAAFNAFQDADEPQAMIDAIEKHPILSNREFIQAIENYVNEQVPPEHQPVFKRRLNWLREIVERADPIQAAIEAFQQASSFEEMHVVLQRHPILHDDSFIQLISKYINEDAPQARRTVLQQQLSWLTKLVNK